jgi:hypothetical protein
VSETAELLASVRRTKIARVQRVRYVFEGSVTDDDGPLQVSFDSGALLRFDVGGDGEILKVDTTPWVDPFKEPLSDENRECVVQSGKWTEFDVSEEPPYSSVIGDTVYQVRLITLTDGKLVGVIFSGGKSELAASTGADNLQVTIR